MAKKKKQGAIINPFIKNATAIANTVKTAANEVKESLNTVSTKVKTATKTTPKTTFEESRTSRDFMINPLGERIRERGEILAKENYERQKVLTAMNNSPSASPGDKFMREFLSSDAFYYNIPNNEDFDEYVEKGRERANKMPGKGEKYDERKHGNKVVTARMNPEVSKQYGGEDSLLAFTTDEEEGIYSYFLGKDEYDAAEEFLDTIHATLVARRGGEWADNVKNSKGIGRLGMYATASLGGGLDQAFRGFDSVPGLIGLTDDAAPVTSMEIANDEIIKDLDGFGYYLYGAGNTVGNMLPSIMAGNIGGSLVGSLTMGVSSAGGAYRQAIKEGYSPEQARQYGIAVGASEATLQSLIGGIGKLGGVGTEKILSKVKLIDNAIARVTLTGGVKIGSEITEEELQLFLEPAFRKIIFGEDYTVPEIDEFIDTAIMTALSTGALSGGEIISAGKSNSEYDKEVLKDFNIKDKADRDMFIDAIINEGLSAKKGTDSYIMAKTLQGKVKNGKEITDHQLGTLYDANVRNVNSAKDTENDIPGNDFIDAIEERNLPLEERLLRAAAREKVDYDTGFSRSGKVETTKGDLKKVKGYGYGKKGENAFMKVMTENQWTPETTQKRFRTAYDAGFLGLRRDQVEILTPVQEMAYYSGRKDAILSMDDAKAKGVATWGNESGLVKNKYSQKYDESTFSAVDTMGKAMGTKIIVEYIPPEKNSNGYYRDQDGTIHIGTNIADPVMTVVKHEITHRMKDLAPKEYMAYRDFAVEVMSDWGLGSKTVVEAIQFDYHDRGNIDLDVESAMDEIAADMTRAILSDEKALRRFIDHAKTSKANMNMANKFFQAVREFINKVKATFSGNRQKMDEATRDEFGLTLEQLERAESLWKEAYRASETSAKKKGKNQSDGKNAVENTNHKDKHMLIGENAKIRRDYRLSKAKAMEGEGVSKEAIFKKTGWFRGADGRWRFEISDKDFVYKQPIMPSSQNVKRWRELTMKMARGDLSEVEQKEYIELEKYVRVYSLEEIIDHKDLFRAYPKLKKIGVLYTYDLSKGMSAAYDPIFKLIYLDANQTKEFNRTSILHEIQHAIQHIEKFSSASNPKFWENNMSEGYAKNDSISGQPMTAHDLYMNTAGEIEARDTARRAELTDEQRIEKFPNIGNENTVLSDMWEAISFKADNEGSEDASTVSENVENKVANYVAHEENKGYNEEGQDLMYSPKNNEDIKHSLKWRTDLNKNQMEELLQDIKHEVKLSQNYITDGAKWIFSDIGGTDVFAIYSTDNIKDPTVLYASKGKKAETERSRLLDILEVEKNVKNANGTSGIVGRVSSGNWMQNAHGMAGGGNGLPGSKSGVGNATVLQGKPSANGSRAFRNVIESLFKISSEGRGGQDGISHSLKKGIDAEKTNNSIIESEDFTDEQGNLLPDGGSKRAYSASSGKQARGMDGRTRRYKERRTTNYERRKYCQTLRTSGDTSRRVIYGHDCEVISEEHYTPYMAKIAQRNEKDGIDETIFVVGEITLTSKKDKNGNLKTARGAYIKQNGKKTIIVQCDNYFYTPEQINDHEKIHDRYNTPLVQKAKKVIMNSLPVADRKHVLEKLSRDYNGIIKGNEEAIIEEFVANVLSEMDYEYINRFTDVVKAYWKGDETFFDKYKVSEYTESIDAGGVNEGFNQNLREDNGGYTEKEYRAYGWARANNILTAGQNKDYRSKFADAKSGQAKFNMAQSGEYIIPVSDVFESSKRGINNTLVFASGTIENPIISSIIKINEDNETVLDIIRRGIYESERRGIQQETGELFKRYNYTDYEFQPNQQRTGSQSIRSSSDNRHRGRSSGKTESNEDDSKISYSLKGESQIMRDYDLMKRGELSQEEFERRYYDLIEKNGAIEPGEKPSREIKVPKKTDDRRKVSQTVRTILEAKVTPDEALPSIKEMVVSGDFSYDVYTDKQAIKDAGDYIEKHGFQETANDWFDSMKKGKVSKRNTAVGWALYNNTINTAKSATSKSEKESATKTALDILNAMVGHQRNAAQALQATRILKKLEPETQLYNAQRVVDSFQRELIDKYGDKAPNLEIDSELAEKFLNAETQEARDEALREIYRSIGKQMPSGFVDKLNAWRYLSMLGNPRTHIRNVLGNAGFAPIVLTKDTIATGIESVLRLASGGKFEGSKTFVNLGKKDRALIKAAWSDYSNVSDIVANGEKYNDSLKGNKYIEEGRRIFKNKALETVRKGNSALLEMEDVWFSRPHYAYALAQYCKAHNITAEQVARGMAIAPARAYAIKEAQKATYRDTNAFSQMVSGWGRTQNEDNIAKKAFGVVLEGTLPFRKTPANILVRGVEYSPIGLLKGLTADLIKVKQEKITPTEAIDNISAGLTGTGLVMLGVYLAAQGLIRGHGGDDEEENEFKELMGHQAYSLEVGDNSVTLDWLAPEALPFFVGVNLWEMTEGKKENIDLATILTAVGNVSEPMLEMSCLQSLNDLFESVGYATSDGVGALPTVLVSATTSYLTQFIPTIFGQAERTSEGVRMTTHADKNKFLTPGMQRTLGKVSAKIPGWDFNQIPYIDAWGRNEASGNKLKRGANNFLNPAYTSNIEMSGMEKELLRLYEATGEDAVLPKRADKSFKVDGVEKVLTGGEYVRYATKKGQVSYDMVTELTSSEEYKTFTDEERVQAIQETYKYAEQKAKSIVSAYKPSKWTENFEKVGAPVYTSYKIELSKVDDNGNYSNAEKADAIFAMGDLTNDEMAYLWDSEQGWEAYEKGVRMDKYIDFKDKAYGFTSEKDANGKSISGSKKAKVVDYLNEAELTDEEWDYFYYELMGYKR